MQFTTGARHPGFAAGPHCGNYVAAFADYLSDASIWLHRRASLRLQEGSGLGGAVGISTWLHRQASLRYFLHDQKDAG